MRGCRFIGLVVGLWVSMEVHSARAEDWPTYQHDNRRSGVTSESLTFPLAEAWRYRSPVPPMTAWSGPAKWDAYAENEGLQSMRNFDPVFYVTAAEGRVFFGSSVDDAAHCLDAETGEERWVYFTNSAVRLPPTVSAGRAWFGSDDGYVYAVEAATGELLWRRKPSSGQRLIANNEKLISPWPIRSGVLLQEGRAYFAASLLPWETTYLCAVDAVTGEPHFVKEASGITLQGALLASRDRLYAPQGRSVPLVFSVENGDQLGGIAGSGGVYCVLTEEEQLISMPSSQKEKEDTVRIADGKGGQTLVSFAGANRMIVSGRYAYSHQGKMLKAIDRFAVLALQAEIDGHRTANEARAKEKKEHQEDAARVAVLDEAIQAAEAAMVALEAKKAGCELWATPVEIPIGFMLAGDTLLVGGVGEVLAVGADDGRPRWSAEVDGKAYGLAAAEGRLYVSTDTGSIYCFQPEP